MLILTINFPKFGARMKILQTGPTKKTSKFQKQTKMSSREKIKKRKSRTWTNLEVKFGL